MRRALRERTAETSRIVLFASPGRRIESNIFDHRTGAIVVGTASFRGAAEDSSSERKVAAADHAERGSHRKQGGRVGCTQRPLTLCRGSCSCRPCRVCGTPMCTHIVRPRCFLGRWSARWDLGTGPLRVHDHGAWYKGMARPGTGRERERQTGVRDSICFIKDMIGQQ